MKKFLAVVLSLSLVASFAACGKTETSTSSVEASVETSTEASVETSTEVSEETSTEASTEVSVEVEEAAVMTYADYVAAAVDDEVTIQFTVQATQSWWDNKITVYGADADGAYFIYNMACSEEDAAKLVGSVICVNGFKAEWAGEVEVAEGATFEFVDGAEAYTATAVDATAFLGTDDLATYMNQKVSFTDMTVTAVSYKNDTPGDDIYVNLEKDGTEYYFCLEYYLNGSDADFYDLVGNLEVGSVVDVECFLYWYEGPNGHLTAVTVK